jgi:hypothetical protein
MVLAAELGSYGTALVIHFLIQFSGYGSSPNFIMINRLKYTSPETSVKHRYGTYINYLLRYF